MISHVKGPVTLSISRDGGKSYLPEDCQQMKPTGNIDAGCEEYAAVWPSASSSCESAIFRIGCNNAADAARELIVLPIPAIRTMKLSCDWPLYTHRGVTEQASGRLDGLPGTKVSLLADANQPMVQASVVFEHAPPVIMNVSGSKMAAEFVVKDDDRYRIVYDGKRR